jgi:hypothetical protein
MIAGITRAVVVVSTLSLDLWAGGSRAVAQEAAMQVAHVEAVSGLVVAASQGKQTLLDVLDVIRDQTELDLRANSELRICLYRSRKLLTLRGPLRAVISATGLTAESVNAVDSSAETCSAPVVSIFHGGFLSRGLASRQ